MRKIEETLYVLADYNDSAKNKTITTNSITV